MPVQHDPQLGDRPPGAEAVETRGALYRQVMRETLDRQAGLTLGEGTVDRLLVAGGAIGGVVTDGGQSIAAKAVILTSGTFLKG